MEDGCPRVLQRRRSESWDGPRLGARRGRRSGGVEILIVIPTCFWSGSFRSALRKDAEQEHFSMTRVTKSYKGEAMKSTMMILFLWLFGATAVRADIKVVSVKGAVYVRHNVQEEWIPVSRGDLLKRDDSMKSGGKSSASVLVDGKTTVVLPEMAIIDLSDLRSLSKSDLLLKLAMERIRRIPARDRDQEISIPQATTMHGPDMAVRPAVPASDPQIAFMQTTHPE